VNSTTTTLTSSSNPSSYGSSVTLTATVTPAAVSGAMAGTVTFFKDHVALGSAAVSWNSLTQIGTATLADSSLPAGTDSLVAMYSGDDNYIQSMSSAYSQTVNTATPTFTLSQDVSSSVYGQQVTFTAQAASGGARNTIPPSGNVTFSQGGTTLAVVPLAQTDFSTSQAVLQLASLSPGSYTITASYAGDSNYSSTSASVSQTVSKSDANVVFSSVLDVALIGNGDTSTSTTAVLCQPLVLVAKVTPASPGGGVPTGTMTFKDGFTTLGTASLSGGLATLTVSSLSAGVHTLYASYGGDSNFNGSGFIVPVLSQTINGAVNWTVNSAPAAPDPVQAGMVSFGPAWLIPASGDLNVSVDIDADQHADCDCGCDCGCGDSSGQDDAGGMMGGEGEGHTRSHGGIPVPGGASSGYPGAVGVGGPTAAGGTTNPDGCGCADNCGAGNSQLGLAYNSSTVDVLPIILTALASDFCDAVPDQIQAQLTFNGTAQGWLTYTTTGHNSGDVYALPIQAGSAVTSSVSTALSKRAKTAPWPGPSRA
jgi:hypothetical protein